MPENSAAVASSGSQCSGHFPVAFRTGAFDEKIEVIDNQTFPRFLQTEFSLKRLEDIESKLWRVGYPRPPRCLTTQLQLGRTTVLTNALDMHLVWGGGRIFVKPLSRYLLEPEFWTADLPRGIRESALGLLYTYACLITHPTDLKIALEQGLVPKDDAGNEPDWATWRALATELLHSDISRQVHQRFQRGELRLDRLNWIYILRDVPSFQMYHNPWQNYTEFITANLSWITTTTVYIVVVLTAMQVGLSTDPLKDDATFQRASYGFTVFAILGPIIAATFIMLALLIALIPNWVNARSANRRPPLLAPISNEIQQTDTRHDPTGRDPSAGSRYYFKLTTGLFARRREGSKDQC